MYVFKNSCLSIFRNKGRNILIGIIILVIACASTVTLAIRNTAENLVRDYEAAHDIIATISFDRRQLGEQFKEKIAEWKILRHLITLLLLP